MKTQKQFLLSSVTLAVLTLANQAAAQQAADAAAPAGPSGGRARGASVAASEHMFSLLFPCGAISFRLFALCILSSS